MSATTDPPRRPPHVVRLASLTCLVVTAGLLATPMSANAADPTATDATLECGSAEVTRTLPTGSAWRMCVRVHDFKGLVAESVQFKPATGSREYDGWMPVIDSLALAQLNVPYDHGRVGFNDVTGTGMGGPQLLAQNASTCTGTTLDVEQSLVSGSAQAERIIPGICLTTTTTGLAWHSQDFPGIASDRYGAQGTAFEVTSLSRVGWYEYQQRYTFTDQGEIQISLGATGDIGQNDLYFPTDPALGWPINPPPSGTATAEPSSHPGAASHWHNAIYRVDFGIDHGPQQVQRWDYAQSEVSRYRIDGTPTAEAQAFIARTDTPRHTWWRVLNPASINRDGHPRSYEIVNDSAQDSFWELSDFKVAFTNPHPCQEYAWDNLNPGCPGATIDDYVAGDTAPLTDPVAWINSGYHHIVRDEDQSPMPVHWQTVALVPRDMLGQQATTPDERSCINGGPLKPGNSCAAVNTVAPGLIPRPSSIEPGTVLTSTVGTWKTTRSLLRYQRLWLRDGKPITSRGPDGLPLSHTAETYTITPTDRGHRLSVQVFASAPGIIPGSAISRALAVPAPRPPATSPGPGRATATITPRLKTKKGRTTLEVQIGGRRGAATGKVTVRGRNWSRTRTLARGRVHVAVPRRALARNAKLTIRYSGSAVYTSRQQTWKVAKIRS